jgi:hypothetical protein
MSWSLFLDDLRAEVHESTNDDSPSRVLGAVTAADVVLVTVAVALLLLLMLVVLAVVL